MRSGSATDVPPNFWTTRAMAGSDGTSGPREPRRALEQGSFGGRQVDRRARGDERVPCGELVHETGLVHVEHRAQGADVVAPDRQHATVPVAALEHDRSGVADEGTGVV